MHADIRSFVRVCIHCLTIVGGGKAPRPFGPTVHGTAANDLLQFDYIVLAPSNLGDKHVLMLRDDHSDYNWFFSFPDTSAENAARAIIDWAVASQSDSFPTGRLNSRPRCLDIQRAECAAPFHHTLLRMVQWFRRTSWQGTRKDLSGSCI
jgi:hypothetical protein